jgi:hypothetical protein
VLGEALRPYFARIVEGVQQSADVATRLVRRNPELSIAREKDARGA